MNAFILGRNKLDIRPVVTFHGIYAFRFTVTPGNFSDFYITETFGKNGELFGYTRDFLQYTASLTAILLEDFMQVIKHFIDGKMPEDYDKNKTA